MNPILVIAAFVVLLGILLYYMQSREEEPERLPLVKNDSSTEKRVIKASDYQTQYEKDKKEEQPTPEMDIIDSEMPIDDISELDGVGPKYQELFRAAGYTSIKKIAESTPENLYSKLMKVNEETQITKRPPTLNNIEEWIKAASSRQD
jgi:predicted flap endonuclease-1-like 5' DNA nuclease